MKTEKLQLLAGNLKALEGNAVSMARQHPDDVDFWPAFAGYADPIVEQAGCDDDAHEYVCIRIDEILISLEKMDASHRQT